MRTKQQIDEEIVELQIERAFVSAIEADGEKQLEEISEFDKDKSENKKLIATLKRKYFMHNLISSIKIKLPKVCTAMMVVIIFFTTIVATNKTAYAYMLKMLTSRSDIAIDITIDGTDTNTIDSFLTDGYYVPTYLPEGYFHLSTQIDKSSVALNALNKDGQYIDIVVNSEGVNVSFDVETLTYEEMEIYNGNEYYYIQNQEKLTSNLIYVSDVATIMIMTQDVPKDELFNIINGLVCVKVE